MPLNVRRFGTSVLGITLTAVLCGAVSAQVAAVPVASAPAVMGPPTSGDIMRDRISKSKAFIAVRNYNAAIYELENIRKESADPAVQGVVNVLLMNSYLEQGDYKRAQDLLTEFYNVQKTTRANAAENYAAVAGQVVKGARTRAERYKALGLSTSDRTLPLEALNDLEKMRETVELVITHAKEIGTKKERAADAMAMLEEASNSRSMLARDDYDSRRWKDEVADTREKMANGGSVVANALTLGEAAPPEAKPTEPVAKPQPTSTTAISEPLKAPPVQQVAVQPTPQPTPANTSVAIVPVVEKKAEAGDQGVPPQTQAPPPAPTREREVRIVGSAPPTNAAAQTEQAAKGESRSALPVAASDSTAPAKADGPFEAGSLVQYATSQSKPIYPTAAKVVRATGVVRVDVTVDEKGEVTEVQKLSGPMMLQSAAREAIKKWRFRPFTRDGQPVKAVGFVNFNFAL